MSRDGLRFAPLTRIGTERTNMFFWRLCMIVSSA